MNMNAHELANDVEVSSDVLHRRPAEERPRVAQLASHANRLLADVDGSMAAPYEVVDLSAGAGVSCLGYRSATVKQYMAGQLQQLPYLHASQFTCPAIEHAGASILKMARTQMPDESLFSPFDGGAVAFFSGGAEAVEAACKIAMQCAKQDGRDTGFVGRQHSYHGQSVFTLALGDHPRRGVLGCGFAMTPHVFRIPAFTLIGKAPEDIAAYTAEVLHRTQTTLNTVKNRRLTPVIVVETIGGTTIGIAPPTLEYLIGLRKLANEAGAILIYDEILCGNFRCGTMTAWQRYQTMTLHNIAPDIFVMGKGITGGYFPLSCVVINEELRKKCKAVNTVWHTSTNQNAPIGCAAAIGALVEYTSPAVQQNINALQAFMKTGVVDTLRGIDGVNVAGMGTLWGISFDKRWPAETHMYLRADLLREGYNVYSDSAANMIMVAPPYTMTVDELRMALVTISTLLRDLISG